MSEADMVWLTFFVLSVFVGIEVISKVSLDPAHAVDVGRERDPRRSSWSARSW